MARLLSASVRGATHARSGLPNQDAVLAEAIPGGVILAVSDGHGSDKCFRSHIGSRLAVEIALKALSEFAVANAVRPATEIEAEAAPLAAEIVRRWRAAVSEDWTANLVTAEEAAAFRHEPVVAYGATLVCALLEADYLLCLQLGDGEILAASRESAEVIQPIAADATLIANETTSLCQPEAEQKFRIRLQTFDQSPPALILLATDGYPNSFATPEGFRQVATDLLAMLDREGVEPIAAALPGWLEEASQQGSGDDVSVAILYAPQIREGEAPAEPRP